ncbi:uncharacterized protein LOC119375484 [Rhipicephalus sanguineus]|uniref:Uncharacterized protein n=1 Tax=Rhipicephalus sanguineus TaxID=34632 RepID=A0A9D4T472_RHISA|nr:uncharacterized protein LOC119375484 [Rhipicephalus sanguineus]KAH7972376.1 hypothetical protein HPB52_011539 [Rhipicephalus sanguineus]
MASGHGYSLLVLLAAPLLGTCQLQLSDGCKVETLRACGEDFIPYTKGPHLHESGAEFDEGCKRDKVQIPCTLNFINQCTGGLSRAAALVAVKALEENIEAVCNVDSDPYKEYQRGIKCMNSHGAGIHKCIKGFHNTLEQAIIKGPAKETIHYTCCSYYNTLDCIAKTLEPCESVGSKDFMVGVIEQMFGETLNLVCGSYTKGSQSCESLPQLSQLGAKDRRIGSIVELLLEAAGTIGRKN